MINMITTLWQILETQDIGIPCIVVSKASDNEYEILKTQDDDYVFRHINGGWDSELYKFSDFLNHHSNDKRWELIDEFENKRGLWWL